MIFVTRLETNVVHRQGGFSSHGKTIMESVRSAKCDFPKSSSRGEVKDFTAATLVFAIRSSEEMIPSCWTRTYTSAPYAFWEASQKSWKSERYRATFAAVLREESHTNQSSLAKCPAWEFWLKQYMRKANRLDEGVWQSGTRLLVLKT